MKFLAMLRDSFRETLDCKTFWVLLVVVGVLIFLCASTSFTSLESGDTAFEGRSRMGILFGAYEFDNPLGVGFLVTTIESALANVFAGWAGLIFAVVVTASFVPDMLRKGRVDTLISKPIPRSTLLVYKYAGGLIYVLLLALVLIGGCWLALAARSGYWNPSFLWSIPLVLFSFAMLYSFSTWLAVLTRNTLVPILGTLGLWFLGSTLGNVRVHILAGTEPFSKVPPGLRSVIDFIYYVLPKTSDLGRACDYLIVSGNLKEVGWLQLQAQNSLLVEPEWTLLLVSSGAFMVLFVALSCLMFSRRDY